MGKLRDFGFKPEHSQLLSARAHTAPAVAKALSLDEPAPATKPEPAVARAPRVRKVKVSVVTNSGAVTNAARQSRWRSKQDVVALRGQAKERMKGLRARRKVGKAVGS
jgi:hypothetical protein